MADLTQSNGVLLAIAILIAVLGIAWIVLANRKTRVQVDREAEDGAIARRNQALIDAAPAAARAPAPEPLPAAPVHSAAEAPVPVADAVVVPLIHPAGEDDLLLIKGLGPKIRHQLAELGITRFAQIAAWDDAEIDRIDAQLGRFQGRIRRDQWVEQARLLAAGDSAGFAAQFGNN